MVDVQLQLRLHVLKALTRRCSMLSLYGLSIRFFSSSFFSYPSSLSKDLLYLFTYLCTLISASL
jgi:hypothetical protein